MLNERGARRSEIITDPAKVGIDFYVRDVEALRQHVALRRMALIGLSWGSAVVAKYASVYPQNVSRVVFVRPISLTMPLGKGSYGALVILAQR